MPISTTCPCGQTLRVPETAGQSVQCPACGATHVAPVSVKPTVVEDLSPTSSAARDEPATHPRYRASRWRAGRNQRQWQAQRQVYLGCGSLAVLVGLGLVIAVNTTDVRGEAKVLIVGICLAIFGLVSILQALNSTAPDDSDI
ncbi:hypothetical protein J0H58_20465 [bacterium]|nr:hypothetical protein [bacterium]